MLNGEGLRVVLWVAGCGHACPGCHNPVTWDADGGLPFDQDAEDELFAELGKDYVSGVTLSGGDPLFPANRADVGALCARIRQRFSGQDHLAVYRLHLGGNSGFAAAENVDVVVDGRFVQAQADSQLHWRGSANQRVIDVGRTRASQEVVLL